MKEKNENETLYGAISPPPKGATPPGEGELFWIVSPVLCFGWHGYYIGMDFFKFSLWWELKEEMNFNVWFCCETNNSNIYLIMLKVVLHKDLIKNR